MIQVWDGKTDAVGGLKGSLPEDGRFAHWIEHYALPCLGREIASRGLVKGQEARVLVVQSPYHFLASSNKIGFTIHSWETEPHYVWEWRKTLFNITLSPSKDVTEYVGVKGWQYGNIGLYQSNGWKMTHIPTGLTCGASWFKLSDAKAGVLKISEEFDLATIDDMASWSRAKVRNLMKIIKTHRESA